MSASRALPEGRRDAVCKDGRPSARPEQTKPSPNRRGDSTSKSRLEEAALKTHNQSCPSATARVSGHGAQAHAALVTYLVEEGFIEVAGEVARCCSMPRPMNTWVTVHQRPDGKRHVGGLAHCGRMVCPICAPYLMASRMEVLERRVAQLKQKEGLRWFLYTPTIRHRKGAKWRPLVEVMRSVSRRMIQRKPWRDAVVGWVRVLETTYGWAGHHPHEHYLLVVKASDEWEAEGFFQWVQETFERLIREEGRTCDWQPGWWQEVEKGEETRMLHYFGEAAKMGTRGGDALHEVMGSTTKHQPVWSIPAAAFAEIWADSKNIRWFGVGGVMRDQETEKSDEEIEEERKSTDPIVACVNTSVWKSWSPRDRRDRMVVARDPSLPLGDFLRAWRAWGGIVGTPPDLWGRPGEAGPMEESFDPIVVCPS